MAAAVTALSMLPETQQTSTHNINEHLQRITHPQNPPFHGIPSAPVAQQKCTNKVREHHHHNNNAVQPCSHTTSSATPVPGKLQTHTHSQDIAPSRKPPSHSGVMSERSITFSDLEQSLDTNTDAEFAALAQSLPNDWTSVTPIGKTIRKQRLLSCIWGEFKDDESVLSFLKDILLAFPPESGCPAIFDTPNVESIADNRNTIWHRGVHSITHPNGLPHPLASQLTIFQIHEELHYTTLIYDENGAHHYNSLTSTGLPSKVNHIRKRLNRYYSDRAATNPGENNGTATLTDLTRTVRSMTSPSQTDGWTCAMHMLAVTLACTYQNSLPILTYSDQDVQNLHRFHLRHYVTGQLGTDTIDGLAGFIALLQQPGLGTRDYTLHLLGLSVQFGVRASEDYDHPFLLFYTFGGFLAKYLYRYSRRHAIRIYSRYKRILVR